ncbi:MAG TPA: PAS domain-containing sensor histidine kinase [Tepidisphaeraceae bacterium]|jgi:PAS domain S-box-containing protein|nr:PAS domain-containing sensor histidine kinase [Tepidisphaeraceae bacterium]
MRDPQAIPPTAPLPRESIDSPRTALGRQHFRRSAETAGVARPARAGAALREIEARMTAIVNTAMDAMLTIDEKGTIEWLNPAAQAAFGYAAGELIGQNVKVLMPPAYHAAHEAGLRNYLETGERQVIGRGREAVGLRKDGSTFPVDLSVSEVAPSEPDGPRIFLGVVRDITQRKRAEEEIDQTGDLLRAVADGTTDAVFVKDRQGKYLLFNEAAARFVGHPAAQVIGKDDTALFDPEDARMLMALDRRVMERGCVDTTEENLTAAGVTRIYLATKAPYRDRQGNVIGLVGISRDITEFKKAEELRAAKEAAEAVSEEMRRLNLGLQRRLSELEALFNIVPIGIAIADDPECKRMRSNPAFAKMLGIAPEQNASKGAPEGERPENFTCWRNGRELSAEELPMQVAASKGAAVTNCELDLVHDDGHVVRLFGNAVPLFDENGKTRGSIGAFWDIAELKKAEEQMRAAKEAAEEANRAKDDFLATITHELRTPLGAVLLWSKMLRAGQLDEAKSRAAIENIVRCAEDQSRLVNDLLDASQAFHGKMGVEENPVELADVIGSAVDAFTPAAHAKGVALDAQCCQAVVTGDPTRLRQVVSNLLSNAVKFTHAGGRVHVALTRDESHARLEITDTGGGISPEFLPHLFDRFTQADTSTTRKHGGLGLGLSIVRHIVSLHGGTVQAHSEGEGRGAQFTVMLPLAR